MEIRTRQSGDVTILEIDGRLDLVSSSTLKDRLHEYLQDGRSFIVLNGAAMDFINSSGLGRLISVLKDVRLAGGRMVLSSLTPFVDEMLTLTQLNNVFEIYESDEAAVASFAAARGAGVNV